MTASTQRRLPLWGACFVLVALGLWVAMRASIVVDGTRYFWLDDDQMISMRYARNLAAGLGAVWNPGERVEGYTNPAWMAVMALVHLIGVSEAKTSLVVRVLNLAIGCGVLVYSARLLRVLSAPREIPTSLLGAFLLVLATSQHVLYWCFNGFETTALTLTFLIALVDALEHPNGSLTGLVALSLLPLIRGDALHAWAGVAIVLLARSPRRATVLRVAATLSPTLLHLAWRRSFYGEWLPNTYFLKVYGVPGLTVQGLRYVGRLGAELGVPLLIAAYVDVRTRERARAPLYVPIALAIVYVVRVGGDMFEGLRFFAHLLPLVLALGVSAALRLAEGIARDALAAASCVAPFLTGGVHGAGSVAKLQSQNGRPPYALVVGLTIARNTSPDAVIAVHTAGSIPYFAHRRAIDVLGKCDAHIAHLPAFPGEAIGHNKRDADYVFGKKPDIFVGLLPGDIIRTSRVFLGLDPLMRYVFAYFVHPEFVARYLPNERMVPSHFSVVMGPGDPTIFVRDDSPERAHLAGWQMPSID